jgi:hypothetical protein
MAEINEEDLQLIHKNINGTLTDAESSRFEERCQKDPVFRAEALAYDEAKLAAFVGGQSRIKDILKDEAAKYQAENNKNEPKEAKVVPLTMWILRGIAASFLLGVGFWTLNYFQKSQLDITKLVDITYAFTETPIAKVRGDEPLTIDNRFQKRHDSLTIQKTAVAIDFYYKKNYPASIAAFNQITVPDDTLALSKATALLYNNNIQEAQSILIALTQNGKDFTKEYAEWYLALSYLKDHKTDESRALLQKIHAQSAHKFYREAGETLGKM